MEKLPSCYLPRCGASTRRERFQEGAASRHRLANISELPEKSQEVPTEHLLFWGDRRMSRDDAPASGRGIASLVPSLTELVFALGLGDRLVARTGFCIHPAEALARRAKVGGTKTVNLAKLRRLAPTHVLVNVDENRRETVEAIRAWGDAAPEIVVTHPLGPEDNLALVDAAGGGVRAARPGVADRAARAARRRWPRELAATRAGRPPGAARALPDLARPVDDGRARHLPLAHARPDRLADAAGGRRRPRRRRRAIRRSTGDEPWLGSVERVLLSSEPFAFDGAATSPRPQALCPAARGAARRRRAAQLVRRPRRRRAALPARRWPTTIGAPHAPERTVADLRHGQS